EIHNQVRGLQTWPCAVTKINGKNVKIHKTVLSDKKGNKAGMVVDNKNVLTVCCGDGRCVDILELQADGKKRMDTKAFLLGNKIELSTVLGK
ncbi:MAG: methionyl-tRNA formyltransferase, partial [Eubacterium sp.]